MRPIFVSRRRYENGSTPVVFVGSMIGGLVPYLWSGDMFTLTLSSTVGGFLGIWAGFKLAKATGAL